MACALTKGRLLPCKAAFGGIKAVYLADFGDIQSLAFAADTFIATITGAGGLTWAKYDLKGNSSLETTVTSSRENGTTFYTQTLNMTLTFLDAVTQNQLEIVALGRPYAVVEDYYGNFLLCGYENGMEVTGGTVVTGAAAGDLSGFTLTMEGMEEKAPFFTAVPTPITASPINPTLNAPPAVS